MVKMKVLSRPIGTDSQSTGDVSHEPNSELPLLSVRPMAVGASASHDMSVYFPFEAGPHFTDPGEMES